MSLSPRTHPDIALTLAQLLAIRLWARQAPKAHIHPADRGRPGRTQGLCFRELRAYQAGDEARHIDWRVTARLGRPHTRLYGEEQEQTHWLLLDLSPAMYFGSRIQLKARLGCELAAALLWQGEKQANTLLCHGVELKVQPQRGSLVPLLATLCRQYGQGLDRVPPHHSLAQTLAGLNPPHGARVTIIGDHLPGDAALVQQLRRLGLRHDICCWQIRDPLEVALPGTGQLSVQANDGIGWLDGGQTGFGRRYRQAAEQQARQSEQQLLPLVQRLYRLDNGQSLRQQWEGPCHPR